MFAVAALGGVRRAVTCSVRLATATCRHLLVVDDPLRILLAMHFEDRLQRCWHRLPSMLCVGLDPDLRRLPEIVLREADPVFAFNKAIIDATADFCCAFKPQIAYYAAIGAERSLERTMGYLANRFPEHLRLLDAKRGDIGDTASMYAVEAFDRYDADALTANPYLGPEGFAPFVARADRGCFLLCRTSNAGSDVLQGHGDPPLFEQIAKAASSQWNSNRNLGLVAGATDAAALGRIRHIAPDLPLLVPGIGAQGGDLAETLLHGARSDGFGLLINSSRGVIYASSGADFAEAARVAAQATHLAIQQALAAMTRLGSNWISEH